MFQKPVESSVIIRMNLMLETYLDKTGASLEYVDDCDFYPYVVGGRVVGLAVFIKLLGEWQVHGMSSPHRADTQETAKHLSILLAHFSAAHHYCNIFTAQGPGVDKSWCRLVERAGFKDFRHSDGIRVLWYRGVT